MNDIIPHSQIECISRTGDRFSVTIQIGRPYLAPSGEWACPVEMAGWHNGLQDIRGEDSMQALCLALTLVRQLLTSYVQDGGRVG